VSFPAASRYLDILCDTFIVRQLAPFSANLKKRLVKSPKVLPPRVITFETIFEEDNMP